MLPDDRSARAVVSLFLGLAFDLLSHLLHVSDAHHERGRDPIYGDRQRVKSVENYVQFSPRTNLISVDVEHLQIGRPTEGLAGKRRGLPPPALSSRLGLKSHGPPPRPQAAHHSRVRRRDPSARPLVARRDMAEPPAKTPNAARYGWRRRPIKCSKCPAMREQWALVGAPSEAHRKA